MPPLNPFLRAFFRSTLPNQCNPINNHILLAPTTDVLLTSKDRETNSLYADLAASEEFLASHVLRISETTGLGNSNVRDTRGKAKQFTTVNGRIVVVKESFVYSNKGFKTLNQAQLLTDVLYYPNNFETQQWLVYYISRPLIGSFEAIKITPAMLPNLYLGAKQPSDQVTSLDSSPKSESSSPTKKDVKSFNDLLNTFPMIARQMQPGLERVFKEFHKEMSERAQTAQARPSSKLSRRASEASAHSSQNGSIHSRFSSSHAKSSSVATLNVYEEEDYMRRTLESAVTAAIDLFQLVDKQQLSFLGATTELTGPVVERLIERYVTEQLHDSTLFPMLCNSRKLDDLELESQIHHMAHVDISQVGIAIEDGRKGKERLMKRLADGVGEFRKLGIAGSPQQMMDILLATQKVVTNSEPTTRMDDNYKTQDEGAMVSEKPASAMAMNADTLVSLLLVVVIRSQVRHLQARLTYMRNFIFIDDVESGELGYALSTFEAVLSYLGTDSGGLRRASRRNNRLWKATTMGELSEVQAILEPDSDQRRNGKNPSLNLENEFEEISKHNEDAISDLRTRFSGKENGFDEADYIYETPTDNLSAGHSSLAHVFPFQSMPDTETANLKKRKNKRVSMDIRSISNSSENSFKSQSASRTSTIDSIILMMAVNARQSAVLEYLLNLENFYPINVILEDSNSEGTTLLSAAVQSSSLDLVEILLRHVLETRDKQPILDYFAKVDSRGRTVAHYLFNAPNLIPRFGDLLPWRQKDKHGQTPLLALCRSYDHPNYSKMVNDALHFATQEQSDGRPLSLDNHVDGKGNTLLHVVNDAQLAMILMRHCDSDANATNDKRFTPLMVASKYGRVDMVRAFFSDNRVDIFARELRGMTAVELAKDDEIRNRIDDMVLVSNVPADDGRVTAVVRSFFVEDASIRLIIKSAIRNGNGMIGVTTCRRSLSDFENLAKWLSVEHPASWLPSIFNFRSPFQIPSKPSRAALQDIQVRLDRFLKIMLAHSTFSTHELLWEFILFPEIQPEMMAERSRKKAEIRVENIKEQYEPIDDIKDVESFVGHARESIRGVNHSVKSVTRRVANVRNISFDLTTAFDLCTRSLATLPFLPCAHITAFTRYATSTRLQECDPYKFFHQDLQAILSTILAILSSLSRPHSLITSLQNAQKAIERHTSSLRRSDRWPLGLLDETRKGIHAEAQDRAQKSLEEFRAVGSELRYTQQTVAGELAGWQDLHAKLGKRAIRALAERMVIKEKDRLEGMTRAMRGLKR